MTITTLKAAPHLLEATLELIERSFHYQTPNKFSVDFTPLMNESNHHNCFVLVENEKVIAHIGVCEKKILGSSIAMLGGIAVDEARRGEGFFNTLMQDVLAEKKSEVAFFLLWSDQEALYGKYGFYLCGTQIEMMQTPSHQTFFKTKYHLLNQTQKKEIQQLFKNSFAVTYTTPERNEPDWKEIEKITSADLFIRGENDKIEAYFFMNKGQDLNQIIYEYATAGNIKHLIQEISSYGRVWLGSDLVDPQELQYQFFMAPGDTRLFADFIKTYTKDKMVIRDINQIKQEIFFYFNEELLSLESEDFLRGVFGPGIFEEIETVVKPLFISGLVSI